MVAEVGQGEARDHGAGLAHGGGGTSRASGSLDPQRNFK